MITILGAGVAGFSMVKAIRKLDAMVPIRVITADNGDYYYKPNLSTAVSKQKTPQDLVMYQADIWSKQYNVELVTHVCVDGIDTKGQQLLASDQSYSYDKLVIATGSKPFLPPFEGNAVNDVLHVNHLDDFKSWHQKLAQGKRVLIIGAGLVGAEFANDLIGGGYDVTVVAPENAPLSLLIPSEVGQQLASVLEQHGVKWRLGKGIDAINRSDAFDVHLSDGTTEPADLVLAATGLRANAAMFDEHLDVSKQGIKTNAFGETSQKNIFALGDVAALEGISRQYVMPITFSAASLAKTLLGEPTPITFPPMPVLIKTTLYPIVSCLDGIQVNEGYHLESDESGITTRYIDHEGVLQGFVLSGKHVMKRPQLLKEVGHHV